MELVSVLTCPSCGHAERLEMPIDACVFFHECGSCHELLKPNVGDCCVFCTYGSVPCPSIQSGAIGCCASPTEIGRSDVREPASGSHVIVTGEPPRDLGDVAADTAGVTGAIIAALCCAGTPFIVSAFGVLGLSALRKDAILWPVMLGSLALAVWGYWRGFRVHGKAGPMALGIAGAAVLGSGVIVVHGFPAMQMIYGGAAGLVVATLWNINARHA
jgi:hypothetical protein